MLGGVPVTVARICSSVAARVAVVLVVGAADDAAAAAVRCGGALAGDGGAAPEPDCSRPASAGALGTATGVLDRSRAVAALGPVIAAYSGVLAGDVTASAALFGYTSAARLLLA
jgi:hypothetical protein